MDDWQKLNDKCTEELIRLFQGNHEEHAFYVLVHRFGKDLLEKCEINCQRFKHGPDIAEIISEKTFEAYAKRGDFKFELGNGKNVDEAFQLYLYAIARNQLVDYYRNQKKKEKGLTYDGTETIMTELPSIQLDRLDPEMRIKYEIIQSLPPSHRVVYLTYLTHEKRGVNLPKSLQEELRQHLGNVKQNTIRTYKKEAHDKINQGLEIYRISKMLQDGRN